MVEPCDVAVVGSLHLDIMVKGPRLPALDETVIGSTWSFKCGGKGGNQAVAAAKAGATTVFVGRVGDDDFGKTLLANLGQAGIDRARIIVDDSIGSGMSVAIENADGGYGAVVVSGANRRIEAAQFDGLRAKVLLLQNEVDPAINLQAARALKAGGAYVIHNMAPFLAVDLALLAMTGVVIVNRVEALAMTSEKNTAKAAAIIAGLGCDAIVTAGEGGCHVAKRDGAVAYVPAVAVKVQSTHGAGDVFCGVLAASLASGAGLADATTTASTAAARHVSGVA